MSNFKVGDVVRLKSGSPKLTVIYINSEGRVGVNWYEAEQSKFESDVFPKDTLELEKE